MKIFIYYYYIYVLLGILGFFNFPDISTYVTILLLASIIYTFKEQPIITNGMDRLILFYLLYQLLTCVFGGGELIYRWWLTSKIQIVSMAFYFLGRYKIDEVEDFFNNMKFPMLFAMAIGLVLYFWSPSWYIERRTAGLSADSSMDAFYESTRLSSFWPWSYTMGYGSLFYFMFFYKKLNDRINLSNVMIITVSLLTLFFAQQRVSIAFLLVFLGMVIFFNPYGKRKITYYILFAISVIAILILVYLFYFADSGLLDYILNRSVDKEDNIVDERFALFSHFFNVSFFGTGTGSCGHAAYFATGSGITDCDYIRLFVELGIFGSFVLLLIFLLSIIRALRYYKIYFFELSVILFYLAAMIGATPFENYSMQPFLFWLCVGRLYNDSIITEKIYEYDSDYIC